MKSINSWKCSDDAELRLLKRCKSAIRQIVPDAEVILYGSRARRDAREDSDYDVIVVVNGPVDMALEDRIGVSVYPLQLETGALITLIVYSREDWDSPLYRAMPLHKNVEREGVVL